MASWSGGPPPSPGGFSRRIAADDRVALWFEPSFDMLAGVLGVLRAGAAYVPLDPAYPADRVAHALADSGVPAVLTTAASGVEGARGHHGAGRHGGGMRRSAMRRPCVRWRSGRTIWPM